MKGFIRKAVFGLSLALGTSAAAVPVTAVLHLKAKVAMQQLADSVRDPSSPRYQHYYTAAEIRAVAGPELADYQNLLKQLGQEGFRVVSESSTHLWVTVQADHSTFENTFSTRFRHNGATRTLLTGVQIPERLAAVESIVGLENVRKAHPKYSMLAKKAKIPGIQSTTIKQVYGFSPIYSAGGSGSGQHIAVATYDGFKIADVQQYYALIALSPVPKVDQVTFNGTPTYDENSAGETELDSEFSGMIAPGASIHVFASATNDDTGEAQVFTAILDDGRASVVNYSWGSCETQLSSSHQTEMDAIFARAIAQGVNVLVASGDNGSDSCGDGTTAADWPAANPNVVAVGGTSLKVSGTKMSETAWSGSGGGISALFGLPAWQTGLAATYSRRSYPDVSFNADPSTGEPVYITTNGKVGWVQIGGTSMATPQWAGLLTLVGSARAGRGVATLGPLNPILYSVSKTSRASLFNDVISGSNGAYSAGVGWDAVTGLGSPKAGALYTYLVAQ